MQPTASEHHQSDPFHNLIGECAALLTVIETARKLAHTTATITLTGETGVGKEVFARGIHALREAAGSPFVAVNCGALMASLAESELFGYEKGAFSGADPRGKPGKIELARGGTLFLDEIGELPLDLQTKLLRMLEDREYYPVGGTRTLHSNCRFIAATNRDLNQLVAQGKFREDLYYRLSVIELDIPPLRHRSEDIPLLAVTFARQFGYTKPLDNGLQALLIKHPWPGNVRELRNAIERLCVLSAGESLNNEHLPPAVLRSAGQWSPLSEQQAGQGPPLPRQGALSDWLGNYERRFIQSALKETNGNKQAAAQLLGISRMTLYKRISTLFGNDSLN
ncbi:sigma-54 interaction domain-containing protein [Paenibacillus sinopodophylli]|uniref:sigma-54 interaction domain-containing protein n=1 Tax=Paenibacillus sinopodophylli TaxID=1837342 RepID=UPI0014860E58|nr:sigma 54-interacting transcriptional regulator [Paenibacillus sinopodophylli]